MFADDPVPKKAWQLIAVIILSYCLSPSLLTGKALWENMSVEDFLSGLQLDHLHEIFRSEHITMDVLVDMTHEDLQSIGITAFGHRHRILRSVKELAHSGGAGKPGGLANPFSNLHQ